MARIFRMRVPGLGYAVVRGEKIVKKKDLKLLV
jgi:hypothetical protein